MAKRKESVKEVKNFKFKFLSAVILIDMFIVFLTYLIMPTIQGFPPFSENFAFQEEVQPLTHIQQYTVVFAIGIVIHMSVFGVLMRRIYKYLNKYYKNEEIDYEEIKQVRSDCISIPYKVFIVQMLLFLIIGVIFNLIMLIEFFTIIKFTLAVVSITSLLSIFLLIVTQRFLSTVLKTTYILTNEYERNVGLRIKSSYALMLQLIPFIAVVLIMISLVGNAKAVERTANASVNYYKIYLENLNITPQQVNFDNLRTLLDTVPLENEEDYYLIIAPEDVITYTSREDKEVTKFMLSYRDYFYDQTGGVVYEQFGVSEQAYLMEVKDSNNRTWYIGFEFSTSDKELLLFYFVIIIFVLALYVILLYIWSKNISRNLTNLTNSLKAILEEEADPSEILPIMSNDEYGDLSFYYNKIQEFIQKKAQFSAIRRNRSRNCT